MKFEEVTLMHKERMQPYLYRYGQGSCQHSFAAMFCMADKYGDRVCEKDHRLYIYRSGISTEKERAYLFPLGDNSDKNKVRESVEAVLLDAHDHGAWVRFETVTETTKDLVEELFPGVFETTLLRDYAEYIYTYDKLVNLPGHELASKRHDISTFYRDYGSSVRVECISEAHLDAIRAFQKAWLENRLCGVEDVQLEYENAAIQRGLCHFFQLGLCGIVVYIEDELCGYAYGAPLSADSFDVIIEKGDRRIADIYRVLNRELVRLCCQQYRYINREEDVGVAGLRKAKLSYKPDILLSKYLLREVKS